MSGVLLIVVGVMIYGNSLTMIELSRAIRDWLVPWSIIRPHECFLSALP